MFASLLRVGPGCNVDHRVLPSARWTHVPSPAFLYYKRPNGVVQVRGRVVCKYAIKMSKSLNFGMDQFVDHF